MILTPWCDEHYTFIQNLRYEVYDAECRRKMYDFYDSHDIGVLLPGRLNGRKLEYIIEFEYGTYRVVLGGRVPEFWEI